MKGLFVCILLIPVFLFGYSAPEDQGCLYGLVIDTSVSMKPRKESAWQSARLLIEGKRPLDVIFLITFDQDVVLVKEATKDEKALLDTLNNLFFREGPTKLLDALFVSAEHLAKSAPAPRCRGLVLITDGDERNSHYKVDAVLQSFGEKQVPVFIIAFCDVIQKERGKKAQKQAVKLTERIANGTGGKVWYPQTELEITNVANEIASLLRRSGK